jgi:NAD(P)-dependent dehydrogenase (short-subunit alcohol dehydrogenase family)
MKGKVVLITGGTSGIGKATATELARLGATVVFTTRDPARGEAARKEIQEASGSEDVQSIVCDLASFDSIRGCAAEFRSRFPKLDVLINNAGVWDFKRRETVDGVERAFAVNFLAPFLLTNLMLDLLKQSAPSRIINVASALHRGRVNFDDIEFKKHYSGFRAYSQSKLCLILFTRLLSKRLESTGVTANCVHPGMVKSNLSRDSGLALRFFFKLLGTSPEKGARTSVYLASSPEVEGVTGEYFSNRKAQRSSRESYDMDTAERLWKITEVYVGLTNTGAPPRQSP